MPDLGIRLTPASGGPPPPPPPPPPPGTGGKAPPPPPPPGGGPGGGETATGLPPKKKQEPGKRLKQLHWIKVNERKVKTTIWEKMQDDQVQLRREEIENLFEAKVSAKNLDKGDKDGGDELETLSFGPRKKRVVVLLSANRSQTIGVLLSHLKARPAAAL